MNLFQTRRQFIGTTTTAAAGIGLGLSVSARTYAQSNGANNKVVMGLIGCGGMGRGNLGRFLEMPDVSIAAVCDVDSKRMDATAADVVKKNRPEPKKFKDFRDVLDEKDINAVIIATPDHWHAIPFIAACEAGKDIYCEKPISQSFVEAKAMLNAARHFERVVQIGTWQRSMKHFKDAIDIVRSGKIGTVTLCRTWLVEPITSGNSNIGKDSPQEPPAELDWNFWLGPAPYRRYSPTRCHYRWRWFYEYGGGLMTDWGVHMMDIGLLGMNETDPVKICAAGGIFGTSDDRDTPDTLQALYQFPKWNLSWEHRFCNGRPLDGGRNHGTEFVGTKATLIVDREGYQLFPEKDAEGDNEKVKQSPENPHWQNFIDCIRTREKTASDIGSMAKTTMLCHLGNIALQSGKTLHWDTAKQDVANRDDVKHCISYQRDYRKPWKLQLYKA